MPYYKEIGRFVNQTRSSIELELEWSWLLWFISGNDMVFHRLLYPLLRIIILLNAYWHDIDALVASMNK